MLWTPDRMYAQSSLEQIVIVTRVKNRSSRFSRVLAYSSVLLLNGSDLSEIFCVLCLNSEDFKTACMNLHMECNSCRAVKSYGWSLEVLSAPNIEVSALDSNENGVWKTNSEETRRESKESVNKKLKTSSLSRNTGKWERKAETKLCLKHKDREKG